MVKVGELLKLPALNGVTVAAGEDGLLRRVQHVTVMEVPDIKRWLKGNDCLITSFYSVRDSVEAQCALIRDLADTCSCVMVKTGNYVERIDDAVKRTADECSLPLLEIPFHMTYIDIIVSVMNLIFEEKGSSEIQQKYINDILYENYSDCALMAERGRLFGFDVERDYFSAVTFGFRTGYEPEAAETRSLRTLGLAVQRKLRTEAAVKECHLSQQNGGFLLLAGGEDCGQLERVVAHLLTEEKIAKLSKTGTAMLVCGVGPCMRGMDGIRETYCRAFGAARVGQLLYRDRFVFRYDKLRTFCALEDVMTREEGGVFAGILAGIENTELLDTLMVYLECGSSLEKTAERMFTHKNTVKYRLRKIEEQTGLDVRVPSDSFQLFLGALALKMRG